LECAVSCDARLDQGFGTKITPEAHTAG